MKAFVRIFILLLISCGQRGEKNVLQVEKPLNPQQPTTLTYEQVKKSIDSSRLSFARKYVLAGTLTDKQNLLFTAGNFFLKAINEDLFNYWQGTPWDYNGITTEPKKGGIACGYFVTTIMRDAGVSLNRIKLSTCPSLVMMKELTGAGSIRNLSTLGFEQFAERIENGGKGIYIVGLDFHTGFLVNDGRDCWFLHSNYINKAGVMKERLNESAALRASKTRYITNLTVSNKFLRAWLFR